MQQPLGLCRSRTLGLCRSSGWLCPLLQTPQSQTTHFLLSGIGLGPASSSCATFLISWCYFVTLLLCNFRYLNGKCQFTVHIALGIWAFPVGQRLDFQSGQTRLIQEMALIIQEMALTREHLGGWQSHKASSCCSLPVMFCWE